MSLRAAPFLSVLGTALLAVLLGALPGPAPAQPGGPPEPATAPAPTDFSAAERLLLMSPQFGRIKPPTTLGYRYRKGGSAEENFEDRVRISLRAIGKNQCCKASGEFLSGARKLALPEVEQAEGNPVTLYFLEHDIREMNRRTKGSASYFRKRIRMALYQGAEVAPIRVSWRGKPVAAQQIVIRPYLDDPNQARFAQYVGKQYVFVLSEAVPGSVVSIRSQVFTPGVAAALLDEELLLDGAEAPDWPLRS